MSLPELSAVNLVEIKDDAGWSLSVNFGRGDKARDAMRAFSDALRTGQLVERDGVDLVGANTLPTEYVRWLSSIEVDVRVHDLTADEVARLIAAVAPERDALAGVVRCLGFFASVIRSGEPWTDTCEREYRAALTAIKGGGDDADG